MTVVKSIRRKKGGISPNFIKIAVFSPVVMMMVVIYILSGDIPSIDTVSIDSAEISNTVSHVSNVKSEKGIQSHEYWYEKPQPLLSDWPRLERRLDVPPILEKLKFKRGIEVGVQKGILAKKSLMHWKSCEEYKLVDLWGKEDGYQEPGGHSEALKDSWLNNAKSRLKSWTKKGITEFFIMRSTDAAKKMKDGYFDYIYLDARHDFCAVKEDIEHYYPKLRPGGILGGHDYIDAQYAVSRSWKTYFYIQTVLTILSS